MESSPLPKHASPLQQHPVTSPVERSSAPTTPTQTLFLSDPSARLSSSPASSPRIVDSPPTRTKSIRPEKSELMDKRVSPGADFFEDSSGEDGSEWEDEDATRDFSEVEGLGIKFSPGADDNEEEERGRQRGDGVMRDLPPFNQIPAHDLRSAFTNNELPSPSGRKGTKKARQLSLRRLGKARVIHNRGSGSAGRGSPRESVISDNDSVDAYSLEGAYKPFPAIRGGEDDDADIPRSAGFQSRHRSNTNGSESARADSILDAHALTIRALESLPPDVSLSRAHLYTHSLPQSFLTYPKSKSTSFSEHRHIILSPLQTKDPDPDRPAHLPAHFVKTPYPFSATKEFPKPRTKARQRAHGFSEGEYDNKKGKHVLGIVASDGEYDLRSRLERNEDAQGVIRSRSDCVGRSEQWSSWRSTGGVRESVVWLSLKRRKRYRSADCVADRLEPVIVPSSLTTTSPERAIGQRKAWSRLTEKGNIEGRDQMVDFDDMFFATRLIEGYKELAGPWILRALNARTLSSIQLGRVNVWSGSSPYDDNSAFGRLLAARHGLDTNPDMRSPFTEHNLMNLYHSPTTGKARYTWVHWARRVAASNGSLERSQSTATILRPARRARSLNSHDRYSHTDKQDDDTTAARSHTQAHATPFPDSVTTIQFVHSFSAVKIALVLALMLALSVLAALLWAFLGESAWALPEEGGRAERVGSGMLIGVLVLGLEGVVFVGWIMGSWMWL